MEEQPRKHNYQKIGCNLRRVAQHSGSIKIAVIGIIILLLTIPSTMISSLVQERKSRHDKAIIEISDKWGGNQIVSGPILSVPYMGERAVTANGFNNSTGYLHFLPRTLDIRGTLDPELRHRGIFRAPLYRTTLDIQGDFAPLQTKKLQVNPEEIQWDKAFLSMGMSDTAGLGQKIKCFINNEEQIIQPGIESSDVFAAGLSIPYEYNKEETTSFRIQLQINGSKELQFLPLGQITRVHLTSSWKDPSFIGDFLPSQYDVSDKGFQAEWQISHFNRNYPQSWLGAYQKISSSSFGVKMLEGTNIYQNTTRTVKYSMLFLVFSFTAFFLAEILTNHRVHPIQYLFIGFGITCFYSTLLAFSEHVGFNQAFIIATLAVISLIGLYTKAILGLKMATVTSCLLATLYAYLFVTLQLQDYALVVGSCGLFALLGLVMYVTRKVDWYNIRDEKAEE